VKDINKRIRIMTTTQTRTYNGWTNYETWNVSLWLDEEDYMHCVPFEMREYKDNAYGLSKVIEDYVEEMRPEMPPSMFCDLLGAALSEVNWIEIAEHYLSDLED